MLSKFKMNIIHVDKFRMYLCSNYANKKYVSKRYANKKRATFNQNKFCSEQASDVISLGEAKIYRLLLIRVHFNHLHRAI